MTQKLLTPIQVGHLTLPNRLVMAPLTRAVPAAATCRTR